MKRFKKINFCKTLITIFVENLKLLIINVVIKADTDNTNKKANKSFKVKVLK